MIWIILCLLVSFLLFGEKGRKKWKVVLFTGFASGYIIAGSLYNTLSGWGLYGSAQILLNENGEYLTRKGGEVFFLTPFPEQEPYLHRVPLFVFEERRGQPPILEVYYRQTSPSWLVALPPLSEPEFWSWGEYRFVAFVP